MFELSKNKKFVMIVLVGIIFLITLGSLSFHIVEGRSYLDSLYFTVITFATIGYGDITPVTDLGKIFAIFYAILGVPLFIGALSIIIESRIKNFVLHHFGHHVRKIEKDEIKIQRKMDKEEIKIDKIQKEVMAIEKTISQKNENIFNKIIKKFKK